jgi:muramoyltetrapeptide carboxypeptidase
MQNTVHPKIRLIRAGNAIDEGLLKQTCAFLESEWGASISYGPEVFNGCSLQDRALLIRSYLSSSDYDTLWTVWGGEGAADLLPYLDKTLPETIPTKQVIGSSDATAILIYLSKFPSVSPIHAPNLGRLPVIKSSASYEVLKSLVCGEPESIVLRHLTPLNLSARSQQALKSTGSTGGNLSLLTISVGDTWEFDAAGKIIFLEDWREKPHVIDRNLKSLARRGKFSKAVAIVVGNVFCELVPTRMDDQVSYLRERLSQFAESLSIPVFETPLIGHGPDNYPVPFRWPAEILAGESPKLIFHRPKSPIKTGL